jgi:putative MATE family efflux protein
MYGAVDTLVVGKFGSDVGLSGVSTGSSIISFITFTVAAFSSAVMIQIARYLGEKKEERIGKVIGGAISFFLVASIILTILLIVFAKDIAILMQSPKEALDKTVIYIQICGAGMVFIVFYNVISSIFRGLGNSKLPLLFVGISCFVNILLDLVFVIIFKMDVAGAALATVIAQTVSVILSIIIILKQKLPFTMSIKDIKFNKEVVLFSKIGLPIALQEILTSVSFAALLAFINKLGWQQICLNLVSAANTLI